MRATINSAAIFIKPSKQLTSFIANMQKYDDMPQALINIRTRKGKCTIASPRVQDVSLISSEDRNFMKTLDLHPAELSINVDDDDAPETKTKQLLTLEDLLWLWNKIKESSTDSSNKPYIHELLMGSEIILPENTEIPRNEELDRRCNRLRIEQQNREYRKMTKNVDSVQKKIPEETIAYQIKQMNRQLIAVFQFVVSVITGFAFGFLGIELAVGPLDFGFRLLLGVICSLIIALAELYFLAKKLNEELQQDIRAEVQNKHQKND